jgi:hypothetical protein
MTVIERSDSGKAGFCSNCGETGLHPNSDICDNCEEFTEGRYIECKYHKCRNIIGPVTVESNEKYCSNECASKDTHL